MPRWVAPTVAVSLLAVVVALTLSEVIPSSWGRIIIVVLLVALAVSFFRLFREMDVRDWWYYWKRKVPKDWRLDREELAFSGGRYVLQVSVSHPGPERVKPGRMIFRISAPARDARFHGKQKGTTGNPETLEVICEIDPNRLDVAAIPREFLGTELALRGHIESDEKLKLFQCVYRAD